MSYFENMRWDVEFTKEFEAWWNSLSEQDQEEISAKVELLEEHGPNLARPHADIITTSRHSNIKELRGKVSTKGKDSLLRVLFAFDPRRTALLLIGGDKTGDPKWYEKSVPIADDLFDQHLKGLEEQKQKQKPDMKGKGRTKK
jgi:hypothetical protein